MARKIRGGVIAIPAAIVGGASDGTVLVRGPSATASVAIVTPFDNMEFLGAMVSQRVAGTGTGTFGIQFQVGSGPTNIGPATATTFVDADAVAGTIFGFVEGEGQAIAAGQQVKCATVKAGTVSADATLEVVLMFATHP